jgi:hypothetical protein
MEERLQHPDSPASGIDWIEQLSDDQCMEIFWLYVDPPEPFLEAYPPTLLGQAMRYALRQVAASSNTAPPSRESEGGPPRT